MSPRIIQMPLSGGDRKFQAREMARVRYLQADLERHAATAFRFAHRLACEEWNARQFIGGDEQPSPSIEAAIDAGCRWLEVICRACRHVQRVELRDLVWPREKPIHSLTRVLYCAPCKASTGISRRPNLVALIAPPDTHRPAAGKREP